MPALELSGHLVDYDVRRSSRARRARIVVHPWDPVEVVLPAGARDADAEWLVRRHEAWLLRRLAERPAPLAPLACGAEVPWRGERRRLDVLYGRGAGWVEPGSIKLPVTVPDDPAAIGRALERLARAEARLHLARAVAEAEAELAVRSTALSIRDQRTRWGSCTSQGRLSFSWRLVLAPPAVLHYVAVHEVCHLVEQNHQPPFWALVERLMPDYAEHRRWLRRHGSTLRF
jgi:predicted metal-dependent hydrolase